MYVSVWCSHNLKSRKITDNTFALTKGPATKNQKKPIYIVVDKSVQHSKATHFS